MGIDKILPRLKLNSAFGDAIVGGEKPNDLFIIHTSRDLETDDLYELRDEVRSFDPTLQIRVQNVGALTPCD